MEPKKLKELVVGTINATFDAWADMATKASNGQSKAITAIRGMQKSISSAATTVDARIYADDEFTANIVSPGLDLGYRMAVVSDTTRNDEWVAALAIDFQKLDEHSRKVLQSHVDYFVNSSNLAGAETRRLLLSVVCAARTVTLDTFFIAVVETSDKKMALVPASPSWAIPQPNGPQLVVNGMDPRTYDERLAIASRRLSVIDSEPAANLMNSHIRGSSDRPVH